MKLLTSAILVLILITSNFSFASINSENEVLNALPEEVKSPPLNIEGQIATKKASPQVSKLKSLRAQLEEKNRQMIENKIEQIRLRQELMLSRKINHSMNQAMSALDK